MNRKYKRPEGWDIMNYCSVEEQMESPLLAMKFFEAGADAMLKALKRGKGMSMISVDSDSVAVKFPDNIESRWGTWVQIPEEEK